jgi:ABC-type sugar transport system substrate-binding protein
MGETVGLFLVGLNDYQERLKEDALKRAKHLGFDVEVHMADNDAGRQLSQIKTAIERRASSGLTAMLVHPVSDNALAAAGRAAVLAGLDWVLLNRSADYLEGLRAEFPTQVIFTVLPDQTEIGRIQGHQVRALAGRGSRVLCVTGRVDTWSARLRLAGLKEAVGAANPIDDVDGSWTSEGARRAIDNWLDIEDNRHGAGDPDGERSIGAFVAQNDDMALGTRQAIREAMTRWNLALGAVPIIGCDGSPRFGQRLVREHRIACTVAVSSAAGPALDWLRRARSGDERPPTQVLIPVTSFPALDELSQQVG